MEKYDQVNFDFDENQTEHVIFMNKQFDVLKNVMSIVQPFCCEFKFIVFQTS